MRVILWDTRKLDVAKDFAGGFGVGQYPGAAACRALSCGTFTSATIDPWRWCMRIWPRSFATWDIAWSIRSSMCPRAATCTSSTPR